MNGVGAKKPLQSATGAGRRTENTGAGQPSTRAASVTESSSHAISASTSRSPARSLDHAVQSRGS
jgi:hypothetical protein